MIRFPRFSAAFLLSTSLACLMAADPGAVCAQEEAPATARPRRSAHTVPAASASGEAGGAAAVPARKEFRVSTFRPPTTGDSAPSLSFFFTSDAVSSSTLGTTRTSALNLVTLDPAAEGFAEWKSTRELRFYLKNPLRPGTAYTARLSPRLRDTQGRRLVGGTEFPFQTRRLTLQGVAQTGFTADRRALVELRFSDQVAPAELRKHLAVSSAGTTIGWELQGEENTQTPQLTTDPLSTESLALRLGSGMRGVSGPLGLTEPEMRNVELNFVLLPEELTARWKQDRPSLVLRFSAPVAMEDIRKHIEVTPPVQWDAAGSSNRVILTGDFQPQTRYRVRVLQGLKGSGGEVLLRDVTLNTWVPPMRAFLHLKEAGGHLSPTGGMRLRVRSAGLPSFQVHAYRLYDNNLVHYVNQNERGYGVRSLGREFASKQIPVAAAPGSATLTEVNLKDLLTTEPAGVYFVSVTARRPKQEQAAQDEDSGYEDDWEEGYNPYRHTGYTLTDGAVITVSNLGIVGKRSSDALTVWVGALDSALPLAGARVRAYSAKNQLLKEGQTGPDGLVTFTGLAATRESYPAVVVAEKDGDLTYLNLNLTMSAYDGDREEDAGSGEPEMSGPGEYVTAGYEAFVSPERGVYRPGETVHLLGHVRDARGEAPAPFPLELQLRRPDERTLEPTPLAATGAGTLITSVTIAEDAPTGYYQATVQMAGTADRQSRAEQAWRNGEEPDAPNGREVLGTTSFYVEEFLPNRLKVETSAPEKRFTTDEPIEVGVRAAEMFGQAAPDRAVTGRVSWSARPFRPAGFSGFAFGDVEEKYRAEDTRLDQTTTGEDGAATVTVPLPENLPNAVLQADIQVTVRDVGGRTITSSLTRRIDTAPYYLGARVGTETFARTGQETPFELVAVRPDGTQVDAAEVTATISRIQYNSLLKRDGSGYRYVTKKESVLQKELAATITAGRGQLTWTPMETGSYVLRVADAATSAVTALPFSVSSDRWDDQPWSLEKPEQVELELDRPSYRPGETARLLVKAPFAGTLLLSLEKDKVVTASVALMDRNTTEVEIPVDAGLYPNFYCVATVVRPVRPADKWLPHRAFGRINARVSSDPRRLGVAVTAPEEVRPGSLLAVELAVQDPATSAPVGGGEVVVWAVDEGILTLTAFETPDPLKIFGAVRRLLVSTSDFFSELMPDILERAVAKSAPGGDGGPGRKRLNPVRNERVKPVVLWHGLARPDEQGRVRVEMAVPQFMGQLRVMAVAANGPRFGSAARTVYVRNPVMVKESLPRFLAPGDAVTVPFSVYNNSDTAQPVRLRLETSGPVVLQTGWSSGAEPGRNEETDAGTVPARGMTAVPVQLAASPEVGQSVIRFTATMGAESFPGEVNLPVRPASPSVRLSGSETVPVGTTRTLALPDRAFMPGTTTGTLVISPRPALRLRNAFQHLYYYRFGCLEQTASSAFPLLFLPDLAEVVEPGRHSRYANEMKLQWSIDRICSMMLPDGSMTMWPGGHDSWTWGSIYAAHFLVEAKKAGYDVPESCLGSVQNFLQEQLGQGIAKATPAQLTEHCYAVYVLSLAGKRELDRMESLYERRADLSPTARAFLASAYRLTGSDLEARELLADGNALKPTVTERRTSGDLDSPTRETAIVLAALLDSNVSAAEVPVLVERLQKLQTGEGHWGTTQDNAFAIWALGKYARRMGETPSEYRGRVVAADGQITEVDSGRSVSLPLASLGKAPVIFLEGRGHAYVEYALEGVPLEPDTTTVSLGLAVERRYQDMEGNPLDLDRLAQGQLVVVEIALSGDRSFDNLVLEDLLPAGLEIENSNLKTSERLGGEDDPEDSGEYGDHGAAEEGRLSVQRTEARDDRMIAFVDYERGHDPSRFVKVFRYAARVVTPGIFILPPVQASCMYDPEVQARSGGGTVQVFGRNP